MDEFAVAVVCGVLEFDIDSGVAGEPPAWVVLVGEFEQLEAAVAAHEYTAVAVDMAEKRAVFAEPFAVVVEVQDTLVDAGLGLIAVQQFDTAIVVAVDEEIAIAVGLGVQDTAVV